MVAIATYDLHLTEEQFWRLTPVQFNKLIERYEIIRKETDYRFGLIASILWNSNYTNKRKPGDFFKEPGEDDGEPTMTGEEMLAHMMGVVNKRPI